MDFDQMLATWHAQNIAPPFDVNRDGLRQALQAEDARVRQELRQRRFGSWLLWIFGTAMAVWAGSWIAITIANGWDAVYAVASAVSLGLFAFGVGAVWASRGRRPERNFGNTLEEEVRRSLALVDYQLSLTRDWMLLLGAASIIAGTGLFNWTVNRSQDIPEVSSGAGWFWFTVLFVAPLAWASYKVRGERRKTKAKLETRQRRLRELLIALEAHE